MYHEVESSKSIDEAAESLRAAVGRHGFGVMHVHDLAATLRSKGVAFDGECRVFEVCNPQQAAKVLARDLRLNNALPCRISVYSQGAKTRIGFIRPTGMLASLSDDPELAAVAAEVESAITRMVEDAR
jgi:uncharacterized protein (DUF302 family)